MLFWVDTMPHVEYKPLVDHISRLEGQLASIKRELQSEAPDCLKASMTLGAASRSFASLKQVFFACFLKKKFLSAKRVSAVDDSPEYQSLLNLIRS